MAATTRVGIARLALQLASSRRLLAVLAIAGWGILHAGNDCIAVKATGDLAPTLLAAEEILPAAGRADGVRLEVAALPEARGPRDAAASPSTAGSNPAGEETFVARRESSFLTADARLARRSDDVAAAFGGTFDERYRQRIAIRPPKPEVLSAAQLEDERIGVRLPANDFSDSGPGTFQASMSGLDVDALRSVAGGRLQLIAADDERGRVLAETRLSWVYEYLQTEAVTSAFFAPGDKGIFAVQGLGYGSNWAVLGFGLRWELFAGLSGYAHYDAQANSQQLFHIGSGGIAYAW